MNRGHRRPTTTVDICNYYWGYGHFESACDIKRVNLQISQVQIQANTLRRTNQANLIEHDSTFDNSLVWSSFPSSASEVNYAEVSSPFHDWYIDSSTTSHVTSAKKSLVNYSLGSYTSQIVTTSGNSLDIHGIDKVVVDENKVILDVLYTLGVTKNLLSVGRITNLGKIVIFDSRNYWVYDKCHPKRLPLHATCSLSNLFYCLQINQASHLTKFAKSQCFLVTTTPTKSKADLWHKCLSYINYQLIYHMSQKALAHGLPNLIHRKAN